MLAVLIKPFHLKIFFSAKHVHGMVLDKLSNCVVASMYSNHYAFEHFLGKNAVRNNEKACELLGKFLAKKMKERQVDSLFWDGVINQNSNKRKWNKEADAIWETIEDHGFAMTRYDPPSQKEMDDRKHAARLARKKGGLHKESRIDPRFRQQMWKLMKKSPWQKAEERAAVAAAAKAEADSLKTASQ